MVAPEQTLDLRGPTRCQVIDAERRLEIIAKLGPDPLAGGQPTPVWAAIRDSRKPIASLLLDQSIVAGVGNIFRAEILFEAELDPQTRGCELDRSSFGCLWRVLLKQMRAGLRYGKIVTVSAKEAGRRLADLEGKDRFRVYGKIQCPRCNGAIQQSDIGSRKMYWCPRCQR